MLHHIHGAEEGEVEPHGGGNSGVGIDVPIKLLGIYILNLGIYILNVGIYILNLGIYILNIFFGIT